jgi:hypothetical protein
MSAYLYISLYTRHGPRPIDMLKSLQGGTGGSSGTAVDRWRENLAVILANRMQGDVKVIGQLGDMLWSTQMRVAAAHFWYRVAPPFHVRACVSTRPHHLSLQLPGGGDTVRAL